MLSIFLVAVGLAIDAFAVSVATGVASNEGQRRKNGLVMASFFAGFQVIMPLIGWAIGLNLQSLIESIAHWVAFGLLTFIGAKMIYDYKDCVSKGSNLRLSSLLTLSVATSIDALMVGLSFAFIQTSIILPIVVIGVVTFSLSFAGFVFGCKIGQVFGCRIKILGGLILIGIGVKILLDAFI